MGYCGLSRADWRLLSPDDFFEVLNARNQCEHNKWERMRILAAISISPYSKHAINPQNLIPLPWDKEKDTTPTDEFVNSDERKAHAQQRLKELGYTNG